MQARMVERGLLDPKQGFPQTNAQNLMACLILDIYCRR